MSSSLAGKPGRSPHPAPRFRPLHRHPLIWLSAALWCVSLLLLAAAAAAAVAALTGGPP